MTKTDEIASKINLAGSAYAGNTKSLNTFMHIEESTGGT